MRMNIGLAIRRLTLEFSEPACLRGPFIGSFIQKIFMHCWLHASPVIDTGDVRVNRTALCLLWV